MEAPPKEQIEEKVAEDNVKESADTPRDVESRSRVATPPVPPGTPQMRRTPPTAPSAAPPSPPSSMRPPLQAARLLPTPPPLSRARRVGLPRPPGISSDSKLTRTKKRRPVAPEGRAPSPSAARLRSWSTRFGSQWQRSGSSSRISSEDLTYDDSPEGEELLACDGRELALLSQRVEEIKLQVHAESAEMRKMPVLDYDTQFIDPLTEILDGTMHLFEKLRVRQTAYWSTRARSGSAAPKRRGDNVQRRGWLEVQTQGGQRRFRKCWFVLEGRTLRYWASEEQKELLGFMGLLYGRVKMTSSASGERKEDLAEDLGSDKSMVKNADKSADKDSKSIAKSETEEQKSDAPADQIEEEEDAVENIEFRVLPPPRALVGSRMGELPSARAKAVFSGLRIRPSTVPWTLRSRGANMASAWIADLSMAAVPNDTNSPTKKSDGGETTEPDADTEQSLAKPASGDPPSSRSSLQTPRAKSTQLVPPGQPKATSRDGRARSRTASSAGTRCSRTSSAAWLPDEVEEAVSRLERMRGRIERLTHGLQSFASVLRTRQVLHAEQLAAVILIAERGVESKLEATRKREKELREQFNSLSVRTARSKKTVRMSVKLAFEERKSQPFIESLGAMRQERSEALFALESIIAARNSYIRQLETLHGIGTELAVKPSKRDYNKLVDLVASRHLRRTVPDIMVRNMLVVVQTLRRHNMGQFAAIKKYKDAKAALRAVEERLVEFVGMVWK